MSLRNFMIQSFEDLEKGYKKTKMILVENPGSNTFEFQDLSKITKLARKKNLYIIGQYGDATLSKTT